MERFRRGSRGVNGGSGVLLKSTRFLIWSKSFIAIFNWV